jgi:hypothetical protein
MAELMLEVGDNPDGWAPPIIVRERGKEESWRVGGPWACCWIGPRGGGKKERGLAGLGSKEEKERGKRKKGSGPA